MTDGFQELQRQLAAGDELAFAALYDRFGGAMYAVAMRLLGNTDEAEDAVQDVFVSLARRHSRLLQVQDFKAYLFASLRHSALKILRSRVRTMETDFAARASVGGEEAQGNEDLGRALQSLPPEQREIVAWKIDAGLTFEQIGRMLDISPNTVASRYRYALEKLREKLSRDYEHRT